MGKGSRRKASRRQSASAGTNDGDASYEEARQLALDGKYAEAKAAYARIEEAVEDAGVRALVRNDLAAIAVVEGDSSAAMDGFRSALGFNADCVPAQQNLALIESRHPAPEVGSAAAAPVPSTPARPPGCPNAKVAVVSFLFNWPSTGGGIMHTVELTSALAKWGLTVRHFFARCPSEGMGKIEAFLPFDSEPISVDEEAWDATTIQQAFARHIEAFDPGVVIVTDSWNFKPWLAKAVGGRPCVIVIQAQECLCPLSNIRLVPEDDGGFRQCNRHQLATPEACWECVRRNGQRSGGLHQAERALSGVGTAEYDAALRASLWEAEAVLVMNPLIESMVAPYCQRVLVTPAAIDASRFPWPPPNEARPDDFRDRKIVFFSGHIDDPIKGFRVLHEACSRLWQRRQDFVLVATGDPAGRVDDFTHYTGWLTQEELPFELHKADLCVVPSIGQESFGRVAAEAMGAGKPVVASRIGGLPYTVVDGLTGLLFEPVQVADLAAKIERLLDDDQLRRRMGIAARRRFDEALTWDAVMARQLVPFLCSVLERHATVASL